jgi:isoleucyl-tRNA synthetase
VTNDDAPSDAFRLNEVPGVAVVVEKAVGTKCARSWKILPTVGDDPEYPDVSPRDAQALREWRALEQGPSAPVAPVPTPMRVVEAVVPEPEISGQQDIEKQPVKVAVPVKRKSAESGTAKTTGETTKKPAENSAKKSGTTASKKAPAKRKAAKKAAKKAAATKGAKKQPAKQKAARKVTRKAAAKGTKKPAKKVSAAKAKKTKKKAR